MYCPKCGAQNSDDARFCRACGMNVDAVSKVLTNPNQPNLPSNTNAPTGSSIDQHRFAKALRELMMGVVFLVIAKFFWHDGWGIWMLIPAAGCFAKGIAGLLPLADKYQHYGNSAAQSLPQAQSTPVANNLPRARNTGELIEAKDFEKLPAPPSVTEQTTRQLDMKVRRKEPPLY